MKDAASIAKYAWTLMCGSLGDTAEYEAERIQKAIERYAARLVKADRERCVLCVICSEDSHLSQTNEQMCRAIIRKINTPATKRPRRKK
jgi:hypothetical protein